MKVKDLGNEMKLELPRAQEFLREQICKNYKEKINQLWADYPKNRTDQKDMKFYIDEIIL